MRGLEPEIQRLLARHNAEIADLEAERERRLTSQERELHQRHLQHVRELRAQVMYKLALFKTLCY